MVQNILYHYLNLYHLFFFSRNCFSRRSGVPLGVLSCAKISWKSDINPSNAIQYQFLGCGQNFGVMFCFSEIFFPQYRCFVLCSLVCQNIIKFWPKPIKCQSIQNCGVWLVFWWDLGNWLDLSWLDLTCLDLSWLVLIWLVLTWLDLEFLRRTSDFLPLMWTYYY